MSNFIPNETKRFVPRDSPWITKPLKTMLNRKNRLFKNYKKHGYKAEDKVRLDVFRTECQQAVETSKFSYLMNLGNKANNPNSMFRGVVTTFISQLRLSFTRSAIAGITS